MKVNIFRNGNVNCIENDWALTFVPKIVSCQPRIFDFYRFAQEFINLVPMQKFIFSIILFNDMRYFN